MGLNYPGGSPWAGGGAVVVPRADSGASADVPIVSFLSLLV